MRAVIDAVVNGVPATLTDIRWLGRTLKQRAIDVLAFFDRSGTSNGAMEAINGRLEPFAAQPWAAGISPTTSFARPWNQAASDPGYTLITMPLCRERAMLRMLLKLLVLLMGVAGVTLRTIGRSH